MIKTTFQISNSGMIFCNPEQDHHQFDNDKNNSSCCQCTEYNVEDMKVIKDKQRFIGQSLNND